MLTEAQLLASRPTVMRIAKRFEYLGGIDDLTQVAMLHLWEKRAEFDGLDIEAVHWAARVARRKFIDAARRRGRELDALATLQAAGGGHRGVATPEETCFARECARVHVANLRRYGERPNPQQVFRARARTAAMVGV
jgi:DNA-directed RNA polymerase specialized sigma24 family protein